MFKKENKKNPTINLVENTTTLAEALDIFKTKLSFKHTPNVFGSHYLSFKIYDSGDITLAYTDTNGDTYNHNIGGNGKDCVNMFFEDVCDKKAKVKKRILTRVDVVSDSASSRQYKA